MADYALAGGVADDADSCAMNDANQIGAKLATWTMVVLLVPIGVGVITLVLAASVAWLTVCVFWRQLNAVEDMAKKMMDIAMSASLPDIILEKATASYGPPPTSKKSSLTKSTSSGSKTVSKTKSASIKAKSKSTSSKSAATKVTSKTAAGAGLKKK